MMNVPVPVMDASSPASSSSSSSSSSSPITDLASLPLVLLINDIARIYRISVGTIRRDCQRGTFRPKPFATRPYKWLRADVERDIEERSNQTAPAPAPHATPQPIRRRLRR